jgi:lantibiotic leader peptide-processing serine protease
VNRTHKRWLLLAAGVLALTASAVVAISTSGARAAAAQTYVVLYNQAAVPAGAASTIQSAGGTLVYSYPQIGVAIARSDSSAFGSTLAKQKDVEGVSATGGFGTQLPDAADSTAGEAPVTPNTPATNSDNLTGLQWDMNQINAPQARAINGGTPNVLVGDIDTGLDYTHPDLAPNVDDANSVNCVSGAPVAGKVAANDDDGHGTHTAGTIAAAANTVGIEGVAPNVKIAGIKAGNSSGFFFPEAVVCAFMWAGTHGVDVTNNSYFADPYLFNCRNDPVQRAIWIAERRAIRFAINNGVTVVAAEGNENKDLSKQNVDTISPDFPPGSAQERDVTNACVVIPVEIPGVVGVTADGNNQQKAYYSSYGVGVTDVVAPGGDRRFQVTAAAPNGRVLSTYPAALNPGGSLSVLDCSVSPCASYRYLQGTSMAAPHVAGVAALIVSQLGGSASPGQVAARLQSTADPFACPPNPFNPGPPFIFQATCTGGPSYNGFYGHGQVNALSAIG